MTDQRLNNPVTACPAPLCGEPGPGLRYEVYQELHMSTDQYLIGLIDPSVCAVFGLMWERDSGASGRVLRSREFSRKLQRASANHDTHLPGSALRW